MSALAAYFLLAIAAALFVLVLAEGLSRRVELFSVRNIYLAGFIIYQLFSPAFVLLNEESRGFMVVDFDRSGAVVALYAAFFVPVFLLAYRNAAPARKLAGMVGGKPATGGDATLLVVAIALVLIAYATFQAPAIPFVSSILFHVSKGFAAVGCVLVGWVCTRRYGNPIVLALSALVLVIAALVGLQGSYGRRPLLAVCIGFGLGFVYGLGDRVKPRTVLLWLAPLSLAGVLVVSAYSAVRSAAKTDETAVERATQMLSAREGIANSIREMIRGQKCGDASLWCIENYPTSHEYRHLFTFRQMAIQIVPRAFWPDKPNPLANDLARLARIQGVKQDKITLPPGVFGYAAAEGGLYALVLYALFYGGFCRFFDQLIVSHREDPFMIAAVSSTLGHVAGLARGDLANLTNNAIVTFAGTLVVIWFVRRFFGKPIAQRLIYWRLAPAPAPDPVGRAPAPR